MSLMEYRRFEGLQHLLRLEDLQSVLRRSCSSILRFFAWPTSVDQCKRHPLQGLHQTFPDMLRYKTLNPNPWQIDNPRRCTRICKHISDLNHQRTERCAQSHQRDVSSTPTSGLTFDQRPLPHPTHPSLTCDQHRSALRRQLLYSPLC